MIENSGEQEETEFLVLILICQRSKTQGTFGFFLLKASDKTWANLPIETFDEQIF